MTKTITPPDTKVQIPVSTSSQTFRVKGRTYEILRFSEGKGPDLVQTIAMVEPMKGKHMLAVKEAKEIETILN